MAITIGCCYYCSRLLLYSYGPPITFMTCDADWLIYCDCPIDCDWSTVEPGLSLASWFWFAVLVQVAD